MIRLKPGDSAQLPRINLWLQSVDLNDLLSHSGTVKGVTGSLFIPRNGAHVESDAGARLKIRIFSGFAVDSEFGTFYVDPEFDTMEGRAEEGVEQGPMSY